MSPPRPKERRTCCRRWRTATGCTARSPRCAGPRAAGVWQVPPRRRASAGRRPTACCGFFRPWRRRCGALLRCPCGSLSPVMGQAYLIGAARFSRRPCKGVATFYDRCPARAARGARLRCVCQNGGEAPVGCPGRLIDKKQGVYLRRFRSIRIIYDVFLVPLSRFFMTPKLPLITPGDVRRAPARQTVKPASRRRPQVPGITGGRP